MINKDKIVASGTDLDCNAILSIIAEHNLSNEWHTIAYGKEMDGMVCGLKDTLDTVMSNKMAAIVFSDNIAVIETEQVQGTPMRYVLRY